MTNPENSNVDEPSPQRPANSREADDGQKTCIGVQRLCEIKGVSMLSLADRSGTGLERLRAIYLGRWTPTPKEREAIAKALDTPSSDIAWEHNTPVEHFYGPG